MKILVAIMFCFAILGASAGCSKSTPSPQNSQDQAPGQTAQPPQSQINVSAEAGKVIIKTTHAQFEILPSGYVAARLLSDSGAQLSLDAPGNSAGVTATLKSGPAQTFIFDLSKESVSEPASNLGAVGKAIDIPGKSRDGKLDATVRVEVYDKFPNVALVSATVKNSGSTALSLADLSLNSHLLDATVAGSGAQAGSAQTNAAQKAAAKGALAPNDMWSFYGSSIEWGHPNVFPVPARFTQRNQMGSQVDVKGDLGRVGGGIPVVAFWTHDVGEAIGHVETLPLVLSIPVHTNANRTVSAEVSIEPNATLAPGERYSTPRTFVAVYAGDYYEPLRMYSDLIAAEGLTRPQNTHEDYAVSWCGWGYLENVTPAQMLGTIPKLKEFGIHWATLDDRWFNNYGDWQPRSDTFPGDTIRTMVQKFHADGIKVQLWWLPLAVEDAGPGYESHPYGVSDVVKQHPDWLILDKDGKPARMTRNLAALCPAVPEVQAYYKQLTERFIKDWDFDGHKLDNIYTVPACYNPAHHHKTPQDSIYAMGQVYKTIFDTTRALKPESVTQACPCGTPPSVAWLRYIDQAVTADPVGSGQVRQRIKMYKALLGDQAAIYGDHVELTKVVNPDKDEKDLGTDFASTLGTGGVLGTKFAWPLNYGPKLNDVYLTAQKEDHWKEWIGIYNQKMLSDGVFKDLYVYGYDVPEAYAIEKNGAMYYAFYVPDYYEGEHKPKPPSNWSGTISLRGLAPGKYQVRDYVNNRDLGSVTAPNATLTTNFTDQLLLEVTPVN